jgi:hypothetical protein
MGLMGKSSTRVLAVTTAAAAVCGLGLAGTASAGARSAGAGTGEPLTAGAAAPQPARAPARPGARLWLSRYNGPQNSDDAPAAMAVSPGGRRVFVTGFNVREAAGDFGDYATVAYDAQTGARLWARRYHGPGKGTDLANSVAVSPDGTMVFVTGSSMRNRTTSDYATIAYNARTGAQLWVRRFGPGGASAVTAGRGGRMVFVTGSNRSDFATVAYDARTGARRWVTRYDGPGHGFDEATSLALSPGAATLFVTGPSGNGQAVSADDYATVAYSTRTGAQRWATRFHGAPNITDDARSMVVSPLGGRVFVTFVTGDRRGAAPQNDYATAAYRAASGAPLWVRRYNGPASGWDDPRSLAASPSGSMVFVTGVSDRTTETGDMATVAYSAAGSRLWVRRYAGPGRHGAAGVSVATGPGGRTVFVTGITTAGHFATVAYRAASGAWLWARRYNGPGAGDDLPAAVAASPAGGRVFVTGRSPGTASAIDFATIAYRS